MPNEALDIVQALMDALERRPAWFSYEYDTIKALAAGRALISQMKQPAIPEGKQLAPIDQPALEEMRARKDAAYLERNQVVAALAKCFPSGIARTAIEGWSDDWHGCVYIDLPTGQVSWHFHDSQAYLFDGLPPYAGKWDGHDTPEKYRRLAAIPQAVSGLSDEQIDVVAAQYWKESRYAGRDGQDFDHRAFARAILSTAPTQDDERRPLGGALAMRVMQSDLYKQLNDAEYADCDELVRRNLEWYKGPRRKK